MTEHEQIKGAISEYLMRNKEVDLDAIARQVLTKIEPTMVGLRLEGEKGWARYEAANRMNRTQEKQIEALNIELTQEKAMLDFMVNEGLFACDIAGEYSLIATENDGYTHEIISGYECPRLAIQSAMRKLAHQNKE